MYRIGRRLGSWYASIDGVSVGILPFVHLVSNSPEWIWEDSVWWAV